MRSMCSENDIKQLFDAAEIARSHAYAPYSGFRVGAALLTRGGKIYTGANVENASYSATLCAERAAFAAAVTAGEREFSAILILGGKETATREPCYPCGVCRQVMQELCDGDFQILLSKNGHPVSYTLSELLPHVFGKESLI